MNQNIRKKKKDWEVVLLPTKYVGLGRETRIVRSRAMNKERRKQIKTVNKLMHKILYYLIFR